MLTHTHKREGATIIVTYSGSLVESIPPPMPGFDKAMDGACSALIIDMSGIDYINSSGVSSFIDNAKYVISRGVHVVLCCLIPQVLKVIKLARTELMIPVVSDRAAAKELLLKMMEKRAACQREQILIVQGKLPVQDKLRDVLKLTRQEANYNIIAVLNPERAWKLITTSKIHLILLDVTLEMPEGHAFIRKLRMNREFFGIPCIVVSDEASLPNAAFYTANGADDILRYPFNQYETPSRLRNALTLFYNWQASIASQKSTRSASDTRPFIRG